ncbi:probable sulfate transporter 3.5 [Phalaenopsis equestris]|uniref:probable sulfate transporter 3.5 n=1 Tax=Phalaenopsis equestris TaxID=78828 RepID=UPI0009E63F93|nr:probable sulfate transporter 3.5 [Phalaenopsis equestris]
MEEDRRRRKVNLASRQPFLTSLKSQLKETFFPDDPFRHFAGQPPARRVWSAISYFVPILQWMPDYSLAFFGNDFFAGVTIASLAVPQGISYAKLAQIPPIIGLYSSFVPPLVYAVFGSSKNMAVGPVAAASLLMAAIIQESVSLEKEPERYVYTIMTSAFFTGLLQFSLGIFRLGIIVDFLARSTITGFMGGTAMIIILQQLKGLLGLKHFTNKTDFISVLHAIFQYRSERYYVASELMICPFSKSAVNYHAGCKTPMANAVMSVCMILVLLFLAPLLKYTPLVALAAIIIVAMIGVIELHEIRHLFRVDKFDFCLCMAALLGVLFINMKTGLAMSFLLSLIRALLHVARPVTRKLGYFPGTDLYRDIDQYPDSTDISGILIIQLGSPMYFANAGYLRERILRWVEGEENRIKETSSPDLQYVIFDMSGVSAIDNSGIGMMLDTHKMLLKKGIKVALTNPSIKVVEKLSVANFIEAIGEEWFFFSISDWFFLSISDAVAGCHFAMQEAN